jgi:hypothetical protein
MKTRLNISICCMLLMVSAAGLFCGKPDAAGDSKTRNVSSAAHPLQAGRIPRIMPDYSETVIPPNIAPLNFSVAENALRYIVEIGGDAGKPVVIRSKTPQIRIPISKWKKFLALNRGKEIRFTVSVLDSGNTWLRFEPVRNRVAEEEIDGYLVYRLMPPLYIFWKKMSIVQRNIGTFDEKTILSSRPLNDGCFNCHSFLKNSPETWMVHLRRATATGMLVHANGKTVLVNTQTEFNKAPAGHPAWHPSGKFLAFSVYKVRQFFHASGANRDALDLSSDLICYDVESNTISAGASIADTARLETYPAWSNDGKWLYFCSAARFDTAAVVKGRNYRNVRYDLMRIAFDVNTASFGKPETFLSSAKTGMSITFPRFSPDGRLLLVTMSAYGNFPLARSSGDLYVVDMRSKQVRKLGCNSPLSDSYHSWSSNGRWFVFSSMRDDGISARPYFSYFDEQGNAHKAFVLPQKDPRHYENDIRTFNIPELITGPITQSPENLVRTARKTGESLKARFVPLKD